MSIKSTGETGSVIVQQPQEGAKTRMMGNIYNLAH